MSLGALTWGLRERVQSLDRNTGDCNCLVTHAAVSANTQVPYSVQLHIVCFCVSPYPWQPHYFHGNHIYIWQSHHQAVVNPVAIAIVGVALGGGKGGGWRLRGGWWVEQYRDHTRTHIRGTCGLCVCKRVCVWIETAHRCICDWYK